MTPATPIFFVLFPGVDPTPEVERVGKKNGVSITGGNFINISMGQGQEDIAIREAKDRGIPVIALCGSDCDISLVDYPIPANDASVASIAYFVNKIAEAYSAGKSAAKK